MMFLPKTPMTENEFISWCRQCADRLHIDIIIENTDCVYIDEDPVQGYFMPPDSKDRGCIVVAKKYPKSHYIAILAHEFMHAIQWSQCNDRTYEKFVDDNYFVNEHKIEIESLRLLRDAGLLTRSMVIQSKIYLMSMFLHHAQVYLDETDQTVEQCMKMYTSPLYTV